MAKSNRSRGTKGSMRPGRSRVARSHRPGRAMRMSSRMGGNATFGHSGTTTPYGPGTPSVKRRDVYDSLRRKGYTKEKAARIANAVARGTNGHGRRGPARKR